MNTKSKHQLLISLLLSFSFVLGACASAPESSSSDGPEGTITISGAWALYPMMTRWAEEYQKVYPNVQFDISAGGAGKGMADALGDIVDIGMVSRNVTPEEEQNGAYWIAVTKDAVLPMVNANNPVINDLMKQGLTQEMFTRIFITGEFKTWGDVIGKPEIQDEIHVYTRSDAAGAPETWAQYLGKKQEDLLGIAVYGDPGLLEAVIKDPLGIGYNNLGYAYDMNSGEPVSGALSLPIDVNENGMADPEEILETKAEAIEMVALGKYPSPPARPLNVVTHGKPEGIIAGFLEWILVDGQKFVGEAGYVSLTADQLTTSLGKLR